MNLSVQNTTPGSGLTYQWESASAVGGPYSNIAGATNPTLIATVTANTFYRSNVICAGNTGTSTPVAVSVSPIYCYPAIYATSNADEDIGNVTVGSLSNTSTCSSTAPGAGSILQRYGNYTGLAAPNLQQAAPTAFSLTSITCGGNYGNGFQIYIDYNRDGDFLDANELAHSSAASTTGPYTESGSFTVPLAALLGITGMRVVNV